jgi:hypothetical protein
MRKHQMQKLAKRYRMAHFRLRSEFLTNSAVPKTRKKQRDKYREYSEYVQV